jgi:hypothetical protein
MLFLRSFASLAVKLLTYLASSASFAVKLFAFLGRPFDKLRTGLASWR